MSTLGPPYDDNSCSNSKHDVDDDISKETTRLIN